MDIQEDFIEFKGFISDWLTARFEQISDNYWEEYVLPSLKEYEKANISYYEITSLSKLDLRANLRVITFNWRIVSIENAPTEIFNWLKEAQSIANRFFHLSSIPDSEDYVRAYDTLWRISNALRFNTEFINDCISKRDSFINNENIDETNSDTSLLALSELFDKRIVLRIPDFQRGYAWEEKHIEQFWEDIKQLDGDSRIHYTGVLTLDKVIININNQHNWHDVDWLLRDSPEYTPYHIIDGQQRITTILILLLCISKKSTAGLKNQIYDKYFRKINRERIGVLFGYESRDFANTYFANRFANAEAIINRRDLYTNRLIKAEEYFDNVLEGKSDIQINSILNKITKRFKFNVYEISNELDTSIIFETMNNRGKALSKLELLKNRLIYLSTRLNEPQDQIAEIRARINQAWATVYEYLGKSKEIQIDDDDFLLNHYYMYYRYDTMKVDLIFNSLFQDINDEGNEIPGKFTMNGIVNGDISLITIYRYVESIEKSIKVWFTIKCPNYHVAEEMIDLEIIPWLEKIKRLPFRAFDPCIMAALLKHNNRPREIIMMLKTIEKFVVKSFFIAGMRKHYQKNYFLGKAATLYNDPENYNLNDFTGDIDSSLQRVVNGPPRTTFVRKFQDLINDFELEKGFYGWDGLHYILYEYELELQNENVSRIKWDMAKKPRHIDHIYPQTPHREWDGIFEGYTAPQIKKMVHSLGNLLLVNSTLNQSFSNRGFDYKKNHRRADGSQAGYFNGSYSEIEVAGSEVWTAREILFRGIKILDFMQRRWQFGLSDDFENRKRLLNLNFLTDIVEV